MFVFKWFVVSALLILLQQPVETSIFLGFIVALVDHVLSSSNTVVVERKA